MSGGTSVAVVALLYGAAGFAASLAAGDRENAIVRARTTQAIDAYRIRLMFVTFGCAAIGGFAATRDLTLEQSVVSAIVVAGLAVAASGHRAPGQRALYLIAIPTFIVVACAALDSMWPAVLSALFAALPFLLTALLLRERRATLTNAAVAAIAGATLGMTSAFFVLLAACVCALVLKSVGRRPLPKLELGPYIAALTLVGILLNMSVLT